MTTIISFISQKGGVGKSTLSQALAVESTKAGLKTLLVDIDYQQTTSKFWADERTRNHFTPYVEVVTDNKLDYHLFSPYDIVIIDGPAHTNEVTIEIARVSHLVIQPSGATNADLNTSLLEFNTLVRSGISKNKMFLALNHIYSPQQETSARKFFAQTSFQVLAGSLPARLSYVHAQNEGKSITEVKYGNLQSRAKQLIASIALNLKLK